MTSSCGTHATRPAALLLIGALMLPACSTRKEDKSMHQTEQAGPSKLTADIARYAPTVVTADTSTLSSGDRRALTSLVRAAAVMDRLFLRQTWSGNEETARAARGGPDARRP